MLNHAHYSKDLQSISTSLALGLTLHVLSNTVFAQYSSISEERERFAMFVATLRTIDKLNTNERAANRSAVFGVTIFSDLSDKEFQTTHLRTKSHVDLLRSRGLMKIAPPATRTNAVTSVDWRGIYTTPIKNRGDSGSDW